MTDSGQAVTKPGKLLPEDVALVVTEAHPYVSRAAAKLLAALQACSPELEDAVALDIGASTGGFTEVLLRHGARRVYAVDVGHGQLDEGLRSDDRVVCIEKTNARHLDASVIPERVDVITADVSFISLRHILPAAAPLAKPNAWVFALVKPQFEAGRHAVGRDGVVRDRAVCERCVAEVASFAERELGCSAVAVVPSPIPGPKGNLEFMLVLRTRG